MAIRPVRLGISASIIAVVVCAVLLWRMGTVRDLYQQAWHEQNNYVRAQRAASQGRSEDEMFSLARVECSRKATETEIRECYWKYLYGDAYHQLMPSFFIKAWAGPLALLSLACALIGVAVALIWKFVPLAVTAWWRWLTAK
jgi:hypothetical protein